MGTPKKKKTATRKATSEEKQMFKAGKRYIKGKTTKNRRATEMVTGQKTHRGQGQAQSIQPSLHEKSPSQRKAAEGKEARRQSFLTETRQGQKLKKMEGKAIAKGKMRGGRTSSLFTDQTGQGHSFKNGHADSIRKKIHGK